MVTLWHQQGVANEPVAAGWQSLGRPQSGHRRSGNAVAPAGGDCMAKGAATYSSDQTYWRSMVALAALPSTEGGGGNLQVTSLTNAAKSSRRWPLVAMTL